MSVYSISGNAGVAGATVTWTDNSSLAALRRVRHVSNVAVSANARPNRNTLTEYRRADRRSVDTNFCRGMERNALDILRSYAADRKLPN